MIEFHRLCALLRRSPKPDATSNNFFSLIERHVTGIESIFSVAAGAIEFGDFKRAVSERCFDALVNRVTDDHLPSLTARPEIVFFWSALPLYSTGTAPRRLSTVTPSHSSNSLDQSLRFSCGNSGRGVQ